jgi:hypothetical protein
MARLEDPVILAMYMSALSNWHVTGYITWKRRAEEWFKENVAACELRAVGGHILQYVRAGGEIDQVRELRPEWNDRDFHYDLRLPIEGEMIYLETILIDDDPSDPTIEIVSAHHV